MSKSYSSKILKSILPSVLLLYSSSCMSEQELQERAEKEILSFMLNFIIVEQIGETAEYISNSGQPWVNAPPGANLITYGEPTGYFLHIENPKNVWWYSDGQLTEAADKDEAIAQYRHLYVETADSNIWGWGMYDFGIISIDHSGTEAKVHYEFSCGETCGVSGNYTLNRNEQGEWEITNDELLGIS